MNYKYWLSEWLENYVEPTHKVQTYERYAQIVEKHIIHKIGDYELNQLTPTILQQFITDMLSSGNIRTHKGLSSNSVNCIISVIKNSLKVANMLGLTMVNMTDKILRPKTVEKQVSCFSVSEQEKIEKYILSTKKVKLYGIIICLYSGLRIGELLALEVDDIDFNKSTMTIIKTCHDSKNGRIINSPKTETSIRVIPLPKSLLYYIKQLKKNTNCKFLISENAKPVSVRSYQKTFEYLLRKLKIQHKSFHSLRHTFATRALENGMDVKTLSEILGHKNPNITLKRYVHSMFEHKRNMMDKLGKKLQKKYIE